MRINFENENNFYCDFDYNIINIISKKDFEMICNLLNSKGIKYNVRNDNKKCLLYPFRIYLINKWIKSYSNNSKKIIEYRKKNNNNCSLNKDFSSINFY